MHKVRGNLKEQVNSVVALKYLIMAGKKCYNNYMMKSKSNGSSLLEVLISISILLIASLMMCRTYLANLTNLERDKRISLANTVINSTMEQIRATPFEALYETDEKYNYSSPMLPDCKVKIRIKQINKYLFNIYLEIEFPVTKKTRRKLKIESYRYRYGI